MSVKLANTQVSLVHEITETCLTTQICNFKFCQVVTLAVYSYFGAAVIGAQWVIPDNEQAYKVNLGFSIFGIF